MKKSDYIRNSTQHETLENLTLPEIVLLSRQKRLREALLASAYAEKDKSLVSIEQKTHKGVKRAQPKIWLIAASIALLLFSYSFYAAFLVAPQTIANITLQVNPTIRLSISEGNTVVDAAGVDEQGELLLTGLDIKGKEVQAALKDITDALRDSGLLGPERRILAVLTAVEDKINENDLALLAQTVRNTLSGYLIEQNILLDVKVTVLSKELSDFISKVGLLPEYYVDLVDAVGTEMAARILNLKIERNIDSLLFKENLDAITSSVIDMTEAQLSSENIIIALNSAITADPKLKMLSAIIDALIELTEKGLSFEEALGLIQRAIQSDSTFKAFDDLIDSYEDDENYDIKDEQNDKADESEETQDNNEQKDEQLELKQTSDDDETESVEAQDDGSQETEDPTDSEQPANEDET